VFVSNSRVFWKLKPYVNCDVNLVEEHIGLVL